MTGYTFLRVEKDDTASTMFAGSTRYVTFYASRKEAVEAAEYEVRSDPSQQLIVCEVNAQLSVRTKPAHVLVEEVGS